MDITIESAEAVGRMIECLLALGPATQAVAEANAELAIVFGGLPATFMDVEPKAKLAVAAIQRQGTAIAALQRALLDGVSVHHDEDAGVYVGFSSVLGTYSQGATEEEAQRAVIDAAQLVFLHCFERGKRILRENALPRGEGLN